MHDRDPPEHRATVSSPRSTPATRTSSRRSSSGSSTTSCAPAVLGRSATDPEGAWLAMEPSTNDILRDRGLALQAIACLDVAIWDVFGRAARTCPSIGSGAASTDSVPISVIGGYYHLDRRRAQRSSSRRYVAAGFAGVKFKVGGADPGRGRRARPVRRGQALGPDFGPDGRCQPGLRPGPGGRLRAARRGPRHPLVRGALPLDQRPALDARRAATRRASRCAPARARRPCAAFAT